MEKPILFNTEMVRAILDGRKTQTRRLIKKRYDNTVLEMKTDKYGTRLIEIQKDEEGVTFGKHEDGSTWRKLRAYIEPKPAYKRGDILYVRETWNGLRTGPKGEEKTIYWYRADEDDNKLNPDDRWRPSIHMPKEAARIWLKVTGIGCQRIQNITVEDARAEGIVVDEYCNETGEIYHTDNYGNTWEAEVSEEADTLFAFGALWDSTVRKEDLEQYGWNANPWVWVIEFERLEGKHDEH